MQSVLEVQNLTRAYDSIKAVDGVSFHVSEGEVCALLGPNGAGKTTTINMILGVLEPTSGSVSIMGRDAHREHARSMQYANFAAVYAQLPGNLTVRQNLEIFGRLYGVEKLPGQVAGVIEEFDLGTLSDTKCGLLSSGEQTRVGLAKALLNRPRLLLLDEPTSSLDPSSANIVREKIRAYAKKNRTAVLWTSHNMHEVEMVCDLVLFLSRGKILLEGDPKTLPEVHGKKNLEELFITIAREPLSLALE